MCTTAAPALPASTAEAAICSGVTVPSSLLSAVAPAPVTAQVMKTSAFTSGLPAACFERHHSRSSSYCRQPAMLGRASLRASLPRSLAHKLARNHQPLDVRGALFDLLQLGVPHPFLDRVFARVAPAAERLYRCPGAPHGRLGGVQLRHRGFGCRPFAGVDQPRGAPYEEA